MLNMLGCGYNHSIAINTEGKVHVWGSSANNELGVSELYGIQRDKPYPLATQIDNIEYQAKQVACGEMHSLILVEDKEQEPIKLVYDKDIDLNYYFQKITNKVKNENFEAWMIKHRYLQHDSKEGINQQEVETFLKEVLGDKMPNETIIQISKVLFGYDESKTTMPIKELRDQLYGARLDSGRVLFWKPPIEDPSEQQHEKEPKPVEFPRHEIITRVACGSSHCMAVASGKKLYTWGLNCHGQLGLGHTENQHKPQVVRQLPADGILDCGGGSAHSAVLMENGLVYTWGLGANGRLGLGSENSKLDPTKITKLADQNIMVNSIAVGHSHTGAVSSTQVYTWGSGSYGRLGHGNQLNQNEPLPIVEFAGKSVKKLVFSVFHSMAIICNGEVWGWGNANDGRLGIDAGNEEKTLIPKKVGTGTAFAQSPIVDVALGLKHSIAVAQNGTLYAWGDTEAGKLGMGAIGVQKQMTPIENPHLTLGVSLDNQIKTRNRPIVATSIYDVRCSDYNTLLLTDSGKLLVTGGNNCGQLGLEIKRENTEDVLADIPENSGIDVKYKPENLDEIAEGQDTYKFIFLKVGGNEDPIIKIQSAGQSMFAITASKQVYSWGNNEDGQLGIGYQNKSFQETATLIKSLTRLRASKVACGPHHTVFVMESGEVYVCGNSEDGKLGIGPNILEMADHSQYLPRMLVGVPIISKISCGYTHTAAIDHHGNLFVWGSGWSGKLGTGSTETFYEPTQVNLRTFVPEPNGTLTKIACGEDHTVVVTSDGYVYSAGIAKYAGHRRPNVNVSILHFTYLNEVEEKICKIAVGRNHSIAISASGITYGWGDTTYAKLGNLNLLKIDEKLPQIAYPSILQIGDALIVKANCGPNHTACLSSDSAIVVWGYALKGRLGIGEPYDEEGKRVNEIEEAQHLEGIYQYLQKNKKKIKKEVGPSQTDEKYEVQSLLENESSLQKHETLLSDLSKLKSQLINILGKYDDLADIEERKQKLMNQFESALVAITAKKEKQNKLAKPSYELTLPPFISKNIQLYEFLIASLQYHPCYIAQIVEMNPNLPATETSGLIESIFGDLEENQRLIRLLMGLHRMIIKISVGKSDFKQALQVKAGDLSAHIYEYILSSQPQNMTFLATIAVLIIKIINNHHCRDPKKNIQHLRSFEVQSEFKETHERQEQDNNECMKEILKLIAGVMQNEPQHRAAFKESSNLSKEVRYMFKEVPQVMKNYFPKDSATREGKSTIHSKVVALFLLPIIDMLKMPEKIKVLGDKEIFRIIKNKGDFRQQTQREKLEEWNNDLAQNKSYIWTIAQGLERFSERETNKYDKYLEKINKALIDVPEITLRDLFLVDMLNHSIEPTAYRHTMTIKSLLKTYNLIFKHLDQLKKRFDEKTDPVILITESLGDTNLFIPQLIDIQHSDYKVNLTLPTRWLLRDKALQVCEHCQMTLTAPLLPKVPEDPTAALSIDKTWICKVCSNIQTDDNNRCMVCNELRTDFPANYIFKPFVPLYADDAFLGSFITLLQKLPPIPKHSSVREFLKEIHENQETDPDTKNMISRFTKSLKKRVSRYLEHDIGREIKGVYNNPKQRQKMACEEIIGLFEEEAKEEYNNRRVYRSYLDYMKKSLKNIEMRIDLETAKYKGSVLKDIDKARKTISADQDPTDGKAQGRFSAEFLESSEVLKQCEIARPIRKNTQFYFIEKNDGSFRVKVIFTERSNKYLCFSQGPNEAQIAMFDIPALKLREMRRTLNSRAITTFDSFTFNVYHLVRLLQRLLGQV